MNEQKSILVADDEQEMRELIRAYLERENYLVDEANDGYEVLDKVQKNSYDLLLLDIMMPELDGLSTCVQIRRFSNVPIIFLSALGEELDRVQGLRIGGDDYIVKPFSPRELMARIEAILRRSQPPVSHPQQEEMMFGKLRIDVKGRSVYVDEHEVTLTPKEFELLHYLAQHEGQVFSREQLLNQVWGFDYSGQERTVDTHVKTIRIKLGEEGERIKTVWGVGYKFEGEP
ncbi:response regulator transcription factor [Thermicanus aegyptius]|uniref:response regulator transcription factor n=1 Tax=Thermicanus aegyptius TaxID=94009 RepID=UPI000344BC0E|nr:response regulator transcription factor [Thermicanus aegyptius]